MSGLDRMKAMLEGGAEQHIKVEEPQSSTKPTKPTPSVTGTPIKTRAQTREGSPTANLSGKVHGASMLVLEEFILNQKRSGRKIKQYKLIDSMLAALEHPEFSEVVMRFYTQDYPND